eukprot:GHVL01021020.1.p1 GENE.GHVL01021020.1~~GHVL01021020.1.p1  ORF type:complete len:326 (-),score=134.71 GHVL01021020.1:57-947(-)
MNEKNDELLCILYANRAMSYLEQNKYIQTISDCNSCLDVINTYINIYSNTYIDTFTNTYIDRYKSIYIKVKLRRSNAYINIYEYNKALSDYNDILYIDKYNNYINEYIKNTELLKLKYYNKQIIKIKNYITNYTLSNKKYSILIKIMNNNIQNNIQNDIQTDIQNNIQNKIQNNIQNDIQTDIQLIKPNNFYIFKKNWKKLNNENKIKYLKLINMDCIRSFIGSSLDTDIILETVILLRQSNVDYAIYVLKSFILCERFDFIIKLLNRQEKEEIEKTFFWLSQNSIYIENIKNRYL